MDTSADITNLQDLDDARQRAGRLAEQQERADIVWLMSGPRGRRIVWRLLEKAGVFRQAFNPDALTMAFVEGCRNEGLRLLSVVHTLPEYAAMVSENARPEPKTQPQELAA